MATANEKLVDQAIQHQVDLAQYSNQVVRRVIRTLNSSEARIVAELESVLSRLGGQSSFRADRLEALLASLRALNAQAYSQAGQVLREELEDFVAYETQWQKFNLTNVLPASVSVASVTVQQVYAAALARPFQGVLLNQALQDVEANTARKIRQAISQGFVESRTTQQIVQEIRGTRAQRYEDGLLARSRRDATAIVRTALSHTAGTVQDASTEANADLIKFVQWSAKLDLKTSEICRIRDNKLYGPVKHNPIGHSYPWLGGPGRAHWQCRSSQIPVLKSFRELGIDLPGSANLATTRASLDGQVAGDISYADWLRNQSFQRQIDVLGDTRARLMRDGKLSLEQMYDQRGRYLTLDQLRARDAQAFKDAGL